MNRANLVGRLTKEVELKYTPNGHAVARFTLAVNRIRSNQNGEREADFINCVAWRRQAENMANFLTKGSRVGVDGRIETRKYQAQDGSTRYITEVNAENVEFLESKNSRNQNGNQSNYTNVGGDPFDEGRNIDISDDDLPF
ncbi:single-stranded DNA-binding protein [Priestia endophytica]|uniref:single-stranded DNA-binding protein n=1 Tax=Priestia endophytica TaxID=135735 RepID=UPI0020411389|nr:single-stranded DNA-binding protein [Priestia endophytica]MCM3536576.1 single-stranded DNA-binding protein [Priestia endophytica]